MESIDVSVIMPVYNSEKFLVESIESILNQTLKNFELIIINDCSTDSSLNIIKKYKKLDKRIVLINNKKNLGQARTRNKGLKIAKGKYIAVLDSDDVSLNKRLEIQFNYLEKNLHIFLVGSSALYIDEVGKLVKKFRKYDNYRIISWRLPKSCGIIHSTVMFRNTKEFWYDYKFKYANEYNLFLNILNSGRNLTNLPFFLIKYRLHSGSISMSKTSEQEKYANAIKKKYKNMKSRINILDKIIFSIKLSLFYIKTFKEKKASLFNF